MVNKYFATNGATGALVYQPTLFKPRIGTITTNPAWSTAPNCLGYDFCSFADVALGTFASGSSGQRAVGTSVYQGNNGNSGTPDINGWYGISDVVDPSMVPVGLTNVFKSGQTTGTTKGTIGSTNYSGLFSGMVWGNPNGATTRSFIVANMVRVDSIGWGFGDSGGPVFVRT